MDALKKEEIYTIDDIYALPEGQRAELIDGKIIIWHHRAGRIKGLVGSFIRQ